MGEMVMGEGRGVLKVVGAMVMGEGRRMLPIPSSLAAPVTVAPRSRQIAATVHK